MIEGVVDHHVHLADYAAVAHLGGPVHELTAEAATLVPRLAGRTVYMLSSTARGGGVAELLQTELSLLRDLGVRVEWLVIEAEPRFFELTKRLHNMIHGQAAPPLSAGDRELYERVSADNAAVLRQRLSPRDLLVVHDPQPLGAGAMASRQLGAAAVWRCHIGLDEPSAPAQAAWELLRPYLEQLGHAVFSAPEYIPSFLSGRASVLHPGIDPLSHKNRELSLHKLVGVLADSGLLVPHWPLVHPPFLHQAQRLQSDGRWDVATAPADLGLLGRPIVTQVSRWDRLKGFLPLLEAFERLKLGRLGQRPSDDPVHRRRLDCVRLVLAGPQPSAIADDPEALAVLEELRVRYLACPKDVQRDVAILSLPMASVKENALMVNALQRASSVVVQNSLRESFGLTVSEAMWKRAPVAGSVRAAGLRHQVRDGLDGCLYRDPNDVDEVGRTLDAMLADQHSRERWGLAGQRRVHDEFLVFKEVCGLLRRLVSATAADATQLAPGRSA